MSHARILAGSAIDGAAGLDAYALFDPTNATVTPSRGGPDFGRQLAVTVLKHHKQDDYLPLEVVELSTEDPWRPIYAATLGLLPVKPEPALLRAAHWKTDLTFEDFLRVNRVQVVGSFEDLERRLDSRDSLSPRQASLLRLAYGQQGSAAMRSRPTDLPDDQYSAYDAGPNVVVLCKSIEDHVLLWNLRSTWGDSQVLPIGIPVEVLTPAMLRTLQNHPHITRNGMSEKSLYVTSASLDRNEIEAALGDHDSRIAVASELEMLDFGRAAGWHRNEVLDLREGATNFVPLPADSHPDLMDGNGAGNSVSMSVDVELIDHRFPAGNDVRADGLNFDYRAGAASRWIGNAHRTPEQVVWPSRWLSARIVARGRGSDLRASEPGRAALVAISGFESSSEIGNLLHAPLLSFLEGMAARNGIGWYKEKLRGIGPTNASEPPAQKFVAPTFDDLPERSFQEFKRALGNSDAATKRWLRWAEERNLVIKGFPLRCELCGSKQWMPVSGFSPPVSCRGCSKTMDLPFADRPSIEFKYRLSERMRRLYEQDAMGHLLVLNYFNSVFRFGGDSPLLGVHPGVELTNEEGTVAAQEVDALLLFSNGNLIPVEVKRSFGSISQPEVSKLDSAATRLRSPWSALAVSDYGVNDDGTYSSWGQRDLDSVPFRLTLSYDHLLAELHFRGSGEDIFRWEPLDREAIDKREAAFVAGQARAPEALPWHLDTLLRRPKVKPAQNGGTPE